VSDDASVISFDYTHDVGEVPALTKGYKLQEAETFSRLFGGTLKDSVSHSRYLSALYSGVGAAITLTAVMALAGGDFRRGFLPIFLAGVAVSIVVWFMLWRFEKNGADQYRAAMLVAFLAREMQQELEVQIELESRGLRYESSAESGWVSWRRLYFPVIESDHLVLVFETFVLAFPFAKLPLPPEEALARIKAWAAQDSDREKPPQV